MLIAGAMTLVLTFVYKKTAEMDRHAIQNSAASVIIFALNMVVMVVFDGQISGFIQRCYDALGIPTLSTGFWSQTPILVIVLVALIVTDFCDYSLHRLMHTRWFWPAHAAHHTDTYVNAFSTFRIHYLEGLLMMVNYMVVMTWLQLPELIPAIWVMVTVHNMYIHLDLPYTHGPLKYLIASPVFHRWHHADVPAAHGKNLANLMPIYDLIFGTYYVPGPCKETLGARSSGLEDKNPFLIWIYPFQEWARLIRASAEKLAGRQSRIKAKPYPQSIPPAE